MKYLKFEELQTKVCHELKTPQKVAKKISNLDFRIRFVPKKNNVYFLIFK